jgi:hypothetical protein
MSALDHAWQDCPGEPDKRSDVNADDVHLSRGVGSVEGAVGSEASVVDQQIDGPVTEFAQQGEDAIAGGKVGRDEGDRAVPGTGNDAVADLLQPVLATSLYDDTAAGLCGDAPAGLDEHPEHGL